MRSLARQTTAPNEVIVVDDGSTDQTAAIAQAAGARVVVVPHRGPARGRNLGAREARGDILVFVDGDMECGPDFVRALTEPIRSNRATGTFTKEIYVANPSNRWAAAYAAMRQLRNGRLLPPDFPTTWDNYRAIRRDAFWQAGGFDDIGYGEDRTVSRKLGQLAIEAPGAVCFHYNPDSLREIFENGRWIGRGAQIREIDPPWRDHVPHRVLRWLGRDIGGGTPMGTAFLARLAYHSGVLLGLLGSALRPERHWK